MKEHTEEGLVVRVTGATVWVEMPDGVVACALRGRFRKRGSNFQVAAGDRASIVRNKTDGELGVLEDVHPRTSYLARYDEAKGTEERVIVANLDMLFVVASVRDPAIHHGFIDRVLVAAERGRTKACLCVNKIDLVQDSDEVPRITGIYESCGYRVLAISARRGDGLDELGRMLTGGIYAFVGESGVGKSSILMNLEPGLDLKVGTLMDKTGRGRHTTTFSQLYRIKGGFVADTPGIQTYGYPGDDTAELAACFPEFAAYEGHCRFHPCSHSHEPDCAVKDAVEEGSIQPTRYRSYLSMHAEIEHRARRRFS
jgi:ribosome biogenesis GTPase